MRPAAIPDERPVPAQLCLVRIRHAWFDPATLQKAVPVSMLRVRERLLRQPYDHASQLLVRRRFRRYARFHFDAEQLGRSFRSALFSTAVGAVGAARTWVDHVAFSPSPQHTLPILTARGLFRLPLRRFVAGLVGLPALEETHRDRLSWAVTLHLDLPNGDTVCHDAWEELDVVPLARPTCGPTRSSR